MKDKKDIDQTNSEAVKRLTEEIGIENFNYLFVYEASPKVGLQPKFKF